jgi:hypothetical protein
MIELVGENRRRRWRQSASRRGRIPPWRSPRRPAYDAREGNTVPNTRHRLREAAVVYRAGLASGYPQSQGGRGASCRRRRIVSRERSDTTMKTKTSRLPGELRGTIEPSHAGCIGTRSLTSFTTGASVDEGLAGCLRPAERGKKNIGANETAFARAGDGGRGRGGHAERLTVEAEEARALKDASPPAPNLSPRKIGLSR